MGTHESGRGSETEGEDEGEDKSEAAQWTVESISRMAANDDALGKEISSIRRAQAKAPRPRRGQLAGDAPSSDPEPQMLTHMLWQPRLSRLLPLSPDSCARLLLDMLAVLNAFFSATWFPLAGFFVPDSCDSFSYRLGVTLGYISSVLGVLDVAARASSPHFIRTATSSCRPARSCAPTCWAGYCPRPVRQPTAP